MSIVFQTSGNVEGTRARSVFTGGFRPTNPGWIVPAFNGWSNRSPLAVHVLTQYETGVQFRLFSVSS